MHKAHYAQVAWVPYFVGNKDSGSGSFLWGDAADISGDDAAAALADPQGMSVFVCVYVSACV